MRHLDQRSLEKLHPGHQRLGTRTDEHASVREVIDVLRRASKVEELELFRELSARRVPCERCLLEVVLDRLHIVVGGLLDGLDLLGLCDVEPGGDGLEQRDRGLVKGRQLGHDTLARQRKQPLNLDDHAMLDEGVFAEVLAQRGCRVAVPPVHGRYCGERGQLGGGGHPSS